jgi:hypothetical protein
MEGEGSRRESADKKQPSERYLRKAKVGDGKKIAGQSEALKRWERYRSRCEIQASRD